jgi:hypothetical protein
MAAGLGFKDFQTGEVLTAADVDGYLMQGIWVFANATARDAAVTSPQEGNACYLKDTNEVLTYSGSTWVAVGGGSPLTTKGDLFTFSTTDARLAVGANGTTLVADSSESTGLKWQTPASGGMTLLSTTTLSGATTTISGIDQTYNSLFMFIGGVTNATANGRMRIAPNGDTAQCLTVSIDSALNAFVNSVNRFTYLFLGTTATSRTSADNSWSVMIDNYASATRFKPISAYGGYEETGGSVAAAMIGGNYYSNTAITSLVFSNAGGNLSTGTVLLYGVK